MSQPAGFHFRRCPKINIRELILDVPLTPIMPRACARTQHNPLRFSCDLCSRLFTTQSGIKRHAQQMHPRPPPPTTIPIPPHNSHNSHGHNHNENTASDIDNCQDAHLLRNENTETPAVAHVEYHKVFNGEFFFVVFTVRRSHNKHKY